MIITISSNTTQALAALGQPILILLLLILVIIVLSHYLFMPRVISIGLGNDSQDPLNQPLLPHISKGPEMNL